MNNNIGWQAFLLVLNIKTTTAVDVLRITVDIVAIIVHINY
jgi:hypothetical protein